MRDPETGRYQREGKWQIMIHGESYKPIVAEAARKAATEVYNRIMVTPPADGRGQGEPGRRSRRVQRAERAISTSSERRRSSSAPVGASHIYKPRAVGEGMGRTWYGPVEQRLGLRAADPRRAKMTQMENRIVLTRFKDGYGPVGAYFLHLKTYTENAYGQEYESRWYDHTKAMVGDYIDRHPVPTCLRNHAFLEEVKAGNGPHSHGDEGGPSRTAQGTGRLGELPRHDDRAGGGVGLSEYRSQAHQPGADDLGALRHGLARHVLRRLGQRPCGLLAGRVPVGIQPDDDRRRSVRRGRHHRRDGPQVLFRIVYRRTHCGQGGRQIRAGHAQRAAPGDRAAVRGAEEDSLPAHGELHGRPQRNRRGHRLTELHPAHPRSSAPREADGRVRRRNQRPLHDQRAAAHPRARAAGHAEGRPRPPRGRRPAPASACVGTPPPGTGVGIGDASHDVPHRDAVAGGTTTGADHPTLDDEDWHCFTVSRFDRNTGEWELEKAPVYHIVD